MVSQDCWKLSALQQITKTAVENLEKQSDCCKLSSCEIVHKNALNPFPSQYSHYIPPENNCFLFFFRWYKMTILVRNGLRLARVVINQSDRVISSYYTFAIACPYEVNLDPQFRPSLQSFPSKPFPLGTSFATPGRAISNFPPLPIQKKKRHSDSLSVFLFLDSGPQLAKSKESSSLGMKVQFERAFKSFSFFIKKNN